MYFNVSTIMTRKWKTYSEWGRKEYALYNMYTQSKCSVGLTVTIIYFLCQGSARYFIG